jgi:ABC-2 type transport system permease protein
VTLEVPAGSPATPDGPSARDAAKTTRVVSARVPVGARIKEIWRTRELLHYLISTEIKVKYKNSALGILWSMVAPAMTLAIFWFVFGVVLKNAYPNFVIYLFSGLLFWNFFQTGVSTATGVIVDRAGIVKKVAFPREILALASIGTSAVFMFFQAIVMVIFLIAFQYAPDWGMLPLLVLSFIATVLIASALGILLSAANVYLRDMRHLIDVVLTAWFWACPIVYSFWHQIRPHLGTLTATLYLALNPISPIILTAQRALYAHPVVHLTSVGHAQVALLPPWGAGVYLAMNLALIVGGVLLLWIALAVFGRLEGNFAEEL